jgi:hypothetical protein
VVSNSKRFRPDNGFAPVPLLGQQRESKVEIKALAGPHAAPVSLFLPGDQPSLYIIGGLTKPQSIAATVLSNVDLGLLHPDELPDLVSRALAVAGELLRQTTPRMGKPEPE